MLLDGKMVDILEVIDPNGHVEQFWLTLEAMLIPSPTMSELASAYHDYGPFEFYSAPIHERQGVTAWSTRSLIEEAYASGGRTALIVWLSGFPANAQLEAPAQATAGWDGCDRPEHALQHHAEKP